MTFPPHCEWEIEDILRDDFFPLEYREDVDS
jgi:hypothetical protein